MTYSTMTQSNTPPRHYHIRQTLSHCKNWQKTNRRQKTEAKLCHALSSSHATILLLMPLEVTSIGLFLNLVVDCAAGFNSLDFQSTAPPKETHVLLCTPLKVMVQQAGASFLRIWSLSVPIMGCAVRVEIVDASPWRCWHPHDSRSGWS